MSSAMSNTPPFPTPLPDGHPLLQPTHSKNTVEVLGDSLVAQETALSPGVYTSRSVLHRAIIGYYLAQGIMSMPVAWLTAGGGGAGKTFSLGVLELRNLYTPAGKVMINADDIKERIPEYRELVKLGDSRAAAIVHEESSQIAKDLLFEAARKKSALVYDATLANFTKGQKLIENLQNVGYAIHLVAVTIHVPTARARAEDRAKKSKRHVPFEDLVRAHWGFNESFPKYASMLGGNDRLYIFENSKENITEMLSSLDDLNNAPYLNRIDERSYTHKI